MSEYFSRQELLEEVGSQGQSRLGSIRILVVGVGGLGCPASIYLAAAGVGVLGLVDHDLVDVTNLHRQILFSAEDVGRPKAQVAAQKLQQRYPHTRVYAFEERVEVANIDKFIHDFDIVVDGSDNFQTKFLLDDACRAARKPLVYGSVNRFEGQVSVFNYFNTLTGQIGPSYRDAFPSETPAEIGGSCAEVGVLGVVPGIVGILQASEAIKLALGRKDVASGSLIYVDLLNLQFDVLRVRESKKVVATDSHALKFERRRDLLVSPAEVLELLENEVPPTLVDLRTANERLQGHLPGLAVPSSELDARIGELTASTGELILYCQSGVRSYGALLRLMSYGLKARSLEGGYTAFAAHVRLNGFTGLPLVTHLT
jgi:molybdopterin/thiamine biosynthesis adenylyltransferase/rhodanese-related sulfurtransferase